MPSSDCSVVRRHACECGLMRGGTFISLYDSWNVTAMGYKKPLFTSAPSSAVCARSFWLKYYSILAGRQSDGVESELDSTAFGKYHWVPPGWEDNGNPMQFEGVMQFRRVLQFYAFGPVAWIRVSGVYTPPPTQTNHSLVLRPLCMCPCVSSAIETLKSMYFNK